VFILEAIKIKKYYGDKLIIAFDELCIQSGEKIGLVGQNGAGKTTLLDILAGEIASDEGVIKRYCDIAYIKQFSDEVITVDGKLLKEFNVQDKVNCNKVSGGEHTRLKIAQELSKDKVLLFADEPTANLDRKGIEALKKKLIQVETLLLISHDRDLLDELCTRIIEIKDGKLSFYEGNFTSYQNKKKEEIKREWFEYNQFIDVKDRLEEARRERQSKSKAMKKAPQRMGNSEARLHKGKTKEKKKKTDKAANIIKTRLEKLEVKSKPIELPGVKFDFSLTDPPGNRIIISCDDLSFCYGSKRIFNSASFKVYNGMKVAIIGNNGAGKTTLLNLISSRKDNIYIVPKAVIGYFYQGFENLDYNKTVLENVMEDSIQTETAIRTILARLLIAGEGVHKNIKVLSGGERIKVSFAKLFVSKANVLLLDEPTNYLDMAAIEALENIIADYEGTVLFVTHDSAFVNKTADRLFILQNGQINEFIGNMKELEESQQASQEYNHKKTQEDMLRMRLAEIIAKMSLPYCDKETLEAEYYKVLEQLKSISKPAN
jgi:macrolide transport system ATP-binding/permease protein